MSGTEEKSPKAWMLLSFVEGQQYAGNRGYDDDPRDLYKYDSLVPNHRRLSEGDVVFIRDREHVLGMAVIQKISSSPGTKTLLRCPACRTTSIKARTQSSPRYRCNNGHTFEEPMAETRDVKLYEAKFGSSFVTLIGELRVEQLRSALKGSSDQLSIQPVDLDRLRPALRSSRRALDLIASAKGFAAPSRIAVVGPQASRGEAARPRVSLAGTDADGTPFDPVDQGGAVERIMRAIKARRGQQRFRDALIDAYEGRCAITGCQVLDVLEAAHITPYLGPETNHVTNGLLLRADLHTLFDTDLIAVDPETRKVWCRRPSRTRCTGASWAGIEGDEDEGISAERGGTEEAPGWLRVLRGGGSHRVPGPSRPHPGTLAPHFKNSGKGSSLLLLLLAPERCVVADFRRACGAGPSLAPRRPVPGEPWWSLSTGETRSSWPRR